MTSDSEFWLFKLQAQYPSIELILLARCIPTNSILLFFFPDSDS